MVELGPSFYIFLYASSVFPSSRMIGGRMERYNSICYASQPGVSTLDPFFRLVLLGQATHHEVPIDTLPMSAVSLCLLRFLAELYFSICQALPLSRLSDNPRRAASTGRRYHSTRAYGLPTCLFRNAGTKEPLLSLMSPE